MMQKKKILVLIGTRPNFVKITRFRTECEKFPNLEIKFVHTGQHTDNKMVDVFFEQFKFQPDYFLSLRGSSVVSQLSDIMLQLDFLIRETYYPDLLVVVGDVNSSLAGALVANKLKIKLAHIEGGLRSFDNEMPEEINRIIIDKVSDLFFVTEISAIQNLLKEGIAESTIHFVGNTMIDSLVYFSKEIENSPVMSDLKLSEGDYFLITLHRPSNVDDKNNLSRLCNLITALSDIRKVVFPLHPRTRNNLIKFGLLDNLDINNRISLLEPLDYFSFQKLLKCSKCVITDSGGVQEETTYLGIPCITLRNSTERPVTTEIGSNTLLNFSLDIILSVIDSIESNKYKKSSVPDLWDGSATERILKVLTTEV